MLSEGIRKRQQRIEGFQEKIDKVMNDIFITRSHAGCSSRQIPDVGLLQYVLKQSTLSAKFCGFEVYFLVFFENHCWLISRQ